MYIMHLTLLLQLIVIIHVSHGRITGSDVQSQSDGKYNGHDSLSYTMRLGKVDYMLEQLNRKIESIETKLTRFEVKFNFKLEKIEELVGAKEIKEDFASDQLTRQIDNLADKLMNKIAFLEAKMGLRIDNINSRFERSDRNLQNSLENVIEKLGKTDDKHVQAESRMWTHITRVDEITNSIVDMKSYVKEEIDNVVVKKLDEISGKIDHGFQDMDHEFEIGQTMISDLNISVINRIDQIENHSQEIERKSCEPRGRASPLSESEYGPKMDIFTSQTSEKLNNLTNTMSEALRLGERKFKELDTDVESYTKKVVYAIHELLKGSKESETLLKSAIVHGNQTRRVVQDGFRKLHQLLSPLIAATSGPVLSGKQGRQEMEPKFEELIEGLQKRIRDLSTTVDTSFATILVAQNSFITSCNRIQEKEPEMESKIYSILEQITQDLQKGNEASDVDTKNLETIIDNHNLEVGKALNDLIWTLLSVSNETKKDIERIKNRLALIHGTYMTRHPSCSCMIQSGDWSSLSDACKTFHHRSSKSSGLSKSSSLTNPNILRRAESSSRPGNTWGQQQFTPIVNQGATMLPPLISDIRISQTLRKHMEQNETGYLSDQESYKDSHQKDFQQDQYKGHGRNFPETIGDKFSPDTKLYKDTFQNKHSKNTTYLGKNDNSQENVHSLDEEYASDEEFTDDSAER